MVSSDAEMGMGDCCVGTIVWVRRRNGSWWPGKILGSEELSASHLMSPRSGTPVKLLGREDASVDWYNLEKSKRVKPFRCGEFDDCIERAEASQGMPPKKREKYARREDAILHALELEKQLLEKKYGKSGVSSNIVNTKQLRGIGKETTESSSYSAKHRDPEMDMTLEDKRKQVQSSSSKVVAIDDKISSFVRPRMRGLQDLGPPSKIKLTSLPASNGFHKHAPVPAVDDGSRANLDGVTPENTITNSSHSLLEKRKRLEDEESVGKRRDKHRPLVQVIESSTKSKSALVNSLQLQDEDGASASALRLEKKQQREVVAPAKVKPDESFDYYQRQPEPLEISTLKSETGLSEAENTSTEDTETDSSGTESQISDTYDALTTLSDEADHIELIPKSFGGCGEHESLSDDSGLPDDSGESLVSKWQLKGKRNSRSLMKRRNPEGSSNWFSYRGDDNTPYAAIDSFNKTSRSQTYRGLDVSSVNWEDLDEPYYKGYWDHSNEYRHDQVYDIGGRMKSMLIDVEVQVQSGYQREHVPMISLMSKLNDHAIIGHPIPVETLEFGSSDQIINSSSAAAGGGDYDEDELRMEALQPWSTARRTVKYRVPRPPHVDEEEEDEEEDLEEHQVHLITSNSSSSSKKGRKYPSSKRPHQRRSSLTSSQNQKIRMLSSIGGREREQGQSSNLKAGEGGVMKTAAVACIPVKLVFSRLHEELVARHQ